VGIFSILKVKDAAFAYFTCVIVWFTLAVYGGFLSVHLHRHFKIKATDIGYYFSCLALPNIVGCVLFPILLWRTPRKAIFICGFLVTALAFLLIGPSAWLGVPDSLLVVIFGMLAINLMQGISYPQVLPEIAESVQIHFKIIEGTDRHLDTLLSDYQSAMLVFSISLGGVLGPLLGACLYDHGGYRFTTDCLMVAMVAIALIFAVFNCGTNYQEERKEQRGKLMQLREVEE